MRYVLLLSLGLLAAPTPLRAADENGSTPNVPPRNRTSETIQLFNGRNLDGWEGRTDIWSVRDGVIVAKNTEPVPVSTYLLTRRKFSDFRLLATVKLVESERHSGIAIWGKRFEKNPERFSYQGHLVMFPTEWGIWDVFRRGGDLKVDGESAKRVGKAHDWNTMEILAQGNRIRVAVNSHKVIDWRDPNPELISEGPIGLQLHANTVPQEVHFKNLVLTTFPSEELITVK